MGSEGSPKIITRIKAEIYTSSATSMAKSIMRPHFEAQGNDSILTIGSPASL